MLIKLIDRLAALNPDAGEIGAGMLAGLVADARRVQDELPALVTLLDRDIEVAGPVVMIRLDGTHGEALATVNRARRVLGV